VEESLPITINGLSHFLPPKIANRISMELEAWLNFETLKVGWYGDESNIIQCQFEFVNEQSVKEIQTPIFSEDNLVLSFAVNNEKSPKQYIVKTLLNNPIQETLIKQQLKIELAKILNLIANKENLSLI